MQIIAVARKLRPGVRRVTKETDSDANRAELLPVQLQGRPHARSHVAVAAEDQETVWPRGSASPRGVPVRRGRRNIIGDLGVRGVAVTTTSTCNGFRWLRWSNFVSKLIRHAVEFDVIVLQEYYVSSYMPKLRVADYQILTTVRNPK